MFPSVCIVVVGVGGLEEEAGGFLRVVMGSEQEEEGEEEIFGAAFGSVRP